MKKFRNNEGFTLIELVMVIVILGILAAAAIPKFADFSMNAHRASIEGVVGGVRAGIAIAKTSDILSQSPSYSATNNYPTILETASGRTAATPAAPLCDLVLDQGGITKDWTYTVGSTSYLYTPITQTDATAFQGGFKLTYVYTNSSGSFLEQ